MPIDDDWKIRRYIFLNSDNNLQAIFLRFIKKPYKISKRKRARESEKERRKRGLG